jgi:hypothetical protein
LIALLLLMRTRSIRFGGGIGKNGQRRRRIRAGVFARMFDMIAAAVSS